MHSFPETAYQTPLPCSHSITNNGEIEDASPSGIPSFRSCLLLSQFSTESRRYGQKTNIQGFSCINSLWDYPIKSSVQYKGMWKHGCPVVCSQLANTYVWVIFLIEYFYLNQNSHLKWMETKAECCFHAIQCRTRKGKKKMLLNKL